MLFAKVLNNKAKLLADRLSKNHNFVLLNQINEQNSKLKLAHFDQQVWRTQIRNHRNQPLPVSALKGPWHIRIPNVIEYNIHMLQNPANIGILVGHKKFRFN